MSRRKGQPKKILSNHYVSKIKPMTRYLILFTLSFLTISLTAQEKVVKLTLQDVIDIASRQSIDAFKQQNMYLSSYWAYKNYRADKLPLLSLGADPFSYSNSNRQDYDYTNQQYIYTQQKNLTSSGSLKLSQNVGLTGGNFSVSSDLGMSKNFIGDKSTLFSANQLSIGYYQTVNGFNSMRWKAKIEPIKFEKAKKGLIQSMEDIAVKATGKFFQMIDAQIEVNISITNLANADTLYQLGKGRYQVGTVTQDELLNMELTQMNAKLAVIKANQGLVRARSDLNSFLALEKGTIVECTLPSSVSSKLQIDVDEAIQKAMENNPDVLSQQQRLLEADRNVAQTKANNGLSVNINASAGLSQKSQVLSEAYQNPNQFQNLAIASLSIPILDWGKRKGAVSMSKSDREVVRNSINQERIDFQQAVLMNVMEFNLQSNQVMNSAKADTIARLGYDVTMRRFKIGKLDVTKLNLARNDVETARRAFIKSLRDYWTNYFTIRQLTLFDFEKRKDLMIDFDKIPTE
jgi:outer membrane protein TolC